MASYSSYGGSSELLKTDSELKYRGYVHPPTTRRPGDAKGHYLGLTGIMAWLIFQVQSIGQETLVLQAMSLQHVGTRRDNGR